MKRIICVAALAATTVLTTAGAGHATSHTALESTGRKPQQILIDQCGHIGAKTAPARKHCWVKAGNSGTAGVKRPTLRCRTYSSVTLCGRPKLTRLQLLCVRKLVESGLSYRRSEVECFFIRKKP
ncbi:hypothetical protein [Nonomuraea sp. NPDC005650]|uniref:hypothetical protein n=1 Tax=Nonomuraea sp. NPDC005650 TaxID=3157045 RepID=UPI0033BBF036